MINQGSVLEGSDPQELAPEFEVCQMKDTHIGASELTLFKSYEIGLLRIRPPVLLVHKVKSKWRKKVSDSDDQLGVLSRRR